LKADGSGAIQRSGAQAPVRAVSAQAATSGFEDFPFVARDGIEHQMD
jgi:hypothetical protein